MTPRLVYLDQNKWIELARAAHNKSTRTMTSTIEFMRAARDAGLVRFPLSLAHYMETDHADSGRTERLGSLMFELSGGYTLASPQRVVEHEIELALALEFGARVLVRPFDLIAKGAAHAAGAPPTRLHLRDAGLGPEAQGALERFAEWVFERTLLTGRDPIVGRPIARADYSRPNETFAVELEARRAHLLNVDAPTRERAIRANALWDIIEPIQAALRSNGITLAAFEALGMVGMDRFLDHMPSRRVELHLWRGWLKHPERRASSHDLNDWAYVGVAAAYCDGVITEKFLARLIQRPGAAIRAKVSTDLATIAAL